MTPTMQKMLQILNEMQSTGQAAPLSAAEMQQLQNHTKFYDQRKARQAERFSQKQKGLLQHYALMGDTQELQSQELRNKASLKQLKNRLNTSMFGNTGAEQSWMK